MPDMARPTSHPYHKDQFICDKEADSYTYPYGQNLPFAGLKNKKAREYRVASGSVCRECPAFGVCTKNASAGRSLEIGSYDVALRRHRNWMATPEAKQAYLRRLPLIEPLFAIIKNQLGARQFRLRGICQRQGRMEPACHGLQSTDSLAGVAYQDCGSLDLHLRANERRRLPFHTSDRHHAGHELPTRKIPMALYFWHQSPAQYFIDQFLPRFAAYL